MCLLTAGLQLLLLDILRGSPSETCKGRRSGKCFRSELVLVTKYRIEEAGFEKARRAAVQRL